MPASPSANYLVPLNPWLDSPERFGRISRWLHWGMALLLTWQFAGMLAKVGLGREAALTALLSPAHAHVGLLLGGLVLLRGAWGLSQRGQRPTHGQGRLAQAAYIGHGLLYLLMLVVPSLAALRMLGNNRAFSWFGVWVLNDGSGERVPWMVAPAAALHGLLGWTLLALIAGHILMVSIHRWVWRDQVAQRMIGRVR